MNSRGTHRPYPTSIDSNIQSGRDAGFAEVQVLYKLLRMPWPHFSSGASTWVETNNCCNSRTGTLDQADQNSIIVLLLLQISPVRVWLSPNGRPVKQEAPKVQLQTFDELYDNDISALGIMRAELVEPPVLVFPHSQGEYSVEIDAYDKHIGCVLLQNQLDGTDRQIRYWSHSLNDAKRAITTTSYKCIAVVQPCRCSGPTFLVANLLFALITTALDGL